MHVQLFPPRLLLEIMVWRQFWGEPKTNGFRDREKKDINAHIIGVEVEKNKAHEEDVSFSFH